MSPQAHARVDEKHFVVVVQLFQILSELTVQEAVFIFLNRVHLQEVN